MENSRIFFAFIFLHFLDLVSYYYIAWKMVIFCVFFLSIERLKHVFLIACSFTVICRFMYET